MYPQLLWHYIEHRRWSALPLEEVRRRQVSRFRRLFEHARERSPFYRRLYRDAGVDRLVIRNMADIERVPIVDKAMLREVPTQEIMTRPITPELVRATTSGSTGEPYVVYQTKTEQYTSHVRVFAMLSELGWRPWHRILMLWRLESGAALPVEQDLGLLSRLRRGLGLFQRDIASIYTPMPEVVRWLDAHQEARVLWTSAGMGTLLCNWLEREGRRYRFDLLVLTSEPVNSAQRARFEKALGGRVVNHYGLMECPTICADPGDGGHFRVQSHACLLELSNRRIEDHRRLGDVVLTNLINQTMPFIRYRTGDTSQVLDRADCPARALGPVVGRLDDTLTLLSGECFAQHQINAIFMNFDLCKQYKIVQYPDGHLALRLHLYDSQSPGAAREQALARWRARFPNVAIDVEFVDSMPVDARTGKFKTIERLTLERAQ